jgi:hypothetical protein
MAFDINFSSVFGQALAATPAVHDGAILIGREKASDVYHVVGWSYRLFPPPSPAAAEPNRGSAFNSCLAMSNVEAIDRIYLASAAGIFIFRQGCVSRLGQKVSMKSTL